jgi:predicted enzyme related to lactoylglutathione lyase
VLFSFSFFTSCFLQPSKKEITMSQDAMKKHGMFSWNELMTNDVEAAKQFYGELLGWSLQPFEGGDMEYTIAKVGDKEVAGIMALPPESGGMPTAWGSYVTVDDVDARTARAESLGGKVCVPPRDIPNVGRFSVIGDPQGIMLGLISYHDK